MYIKIKNDELKIKQIKINPQLFSDCYPTCDPDCSPDCAPNCDPNCSPNCDPVCIPTCSPSCNPCYPSDHCNPEIIYCSPESED